PRNARPLSRPMTRTSTPQLAWRSSLTVAAWRGVAGGRWRASSVRTDHDREKRQRLRGRSTPHSAARRRVRASARRQTLAEPTVRFRAWPDLRGGGRVVFARVAAQFRIRAVGPRTSVRARLGDLDAARTAD